MKTYFPFLRGKQNELLALRALAGRIAKSASVYPIIEPISANSTTRISLDKFVEEEMPFVFITNPIHGEFAGDEDSLYAAFTVGGPLDEYDNFIPALYISRNTSILEVNRFNENYANVFRSVIYTGEPTDDAVRHWCSTEDRIYYHIINDGKVSAAFVNNIAPARRVLIRDVFKRQVRNADFPAVEFFTDLNTPEGNPTGVNWGNYSIQGDHYTDEGGPAHGVALHHVHFSESGESLSISHHLSDRHETTEDIPGKVIEAVEKLVADLENVTPSDTDACGLYRNMAESGHAGTLGYMKRLAIMHHIETILGDD
jgi:hypothetical protein